jgi:hypothetical protein
MKKILVLPLFLACLVGCRTPQAVQFDNVKRAPTTELDIYREGQKPTKEYKEIGEVSYEDFGGEDSNAMKHLIEKAKSIGANGIVLIPSRGTGLEFNPFGRSGDKVLWKAIAIVYK